MRAKSYIAPLAQFDVKELKTDMEWGTDHFDFMLEGVPTFVADQEEANYLKTITQFPIRTTRWILRN